MTTYTAYCGRRELLTSDNFVDAASAEGALEKFYETSGEFRDKFYAVALY